MNNIPTLYTLRENYFFIYWNRLVMSSGYAGAGSILAVYCDWYIRKYAGSLI